MTWGLVASTMLLCGAKKAEEPEAEVTWDHPYLKDYRFDYQWNRDKPRDTSKWKVHYEEMHTAVEFLESQEQIYREEYTLRWTDVDNVPQYIRLKHLDAARSSELIEFEATFTGGGRTDTLTRDRIQEVSADGGSYVDGDTVLALVVPKDRPGTLKVKLAVRSQPHEGVGAYFAGAIAIPEGISCAKKSITFRVPAEQKLHFDKRYFHTKPTQTIADGVRTVRFDFQTLWGSNAQGDGPHYYDQVPVLFWSNQPSVEAMGRLFSEAWEPHLHASPAMVEFAQELTAAAATPREQALAIHDEVADRWGYLGFYPGESGWIPHSAESCFDSRLGDCKDQTALMISLMRAVGLQAWPALIWSGTAPKVPRVGVKVTNHAVVWVEDASDPAGGFLVDSTDSGLGNAPVGDWLGNRKALVLFGDKPRYVTVPKAPREHRLVQTVTRVELDADGSAQVDVLKQWFGSSANARKAGHSGANPVTWDRQVREWLVRSFPGAEIASLEDGPDPEHPEMWATRAQLSTPALVQNYDGRAVVQLPWLNRLSGAGAQKRIHPRAELGSWHVERLEVVLPPGATVLATPGEDSETRDDFVSRYSTQLTDDGRVIVTLDVEALPGRVSTRQENVRVNFYENVRRLQRRPLVIQLGEGA